MVHSIRLTLFVKLIAGADVPFAPLPMPQVAPPPDSNPGAQASVPSSEVPMQTPPYVAPTPAPSQEATQNNPEIFLALLLSMIAARCAICL